MKRYLWTVADSVLVMAISVLLWWPAMMLAAIICTLPPLNYADMLFIGTVLPITGGMSFRWLLLLLIMKFRFRWMVPLEL